MEHLLCVGTMVVSGNEEINKPKPLSSTWTYVSDGESACGELEM